MFHLHHHQRKCVANEFPFPVGGVSKASSNMRLLGIVTQGLMNNWFFKRSGGRTAWTLQLENRTSMSTYMKIVLSCCLKTSRSVLENEKVFFFMPCLCQNFFWLASWIIDLYVICRACATARPLKTMERNFAVLFWAWKLFSTLFFLTFFFCSKAIL